MWNNSNGMVNDDTTNQKQLGQKVLNSFLALNLVWNGLTSQIGTKHKQQFTIRQKLKNSEKV